MLSRVGIVAKRGLTAAVPHLNSAIEWLHTRGVSVVLEEDTAQIVHDPLAVHRHDAGCDCRTGGPGSRPRRRWDAAGRG